MQDPLSLAILFKPLTFVLSLIIRSNTDDSCVVLQLDLSTPWTSERLLIYPLSGKNHWRVIFDKGQNVFGSTL